MEVFDVTRGIWRQFDIGDQGIGHRTKSHVLPISEDSLAVIGGKDEYGVPIDEIGEFNVKHMKCIPTDWRLPKGLSGFASCLLKKGSVAICGGNDGQKTVSGFFILTFKRDGLAPQVTNLPPLISPREDFSLVLGPDRKLYALGGFNTSE